MSQLLEILKPGFLLHHALYGSAVMGFVCPLVGVYFLLRRLVFWGVALPQVSAAGIACAFMLQGLGWSMLAGAETQEKHLAIIGSVVFTGLSILFLAVMVLRFKNREPREGTEEHIAWQTEMERAHGRAEAILGKQRHGPTGMVPLAFEAEITKFSNLAEEDRFPERM